MMVQNIWLVFFILLHLGSLSKSVPLTEEKLNLLEPLTDDGVTFENENYSTKDLTEDMKPSRGDKIYIFYSTVFSNGSDPVITTNISDSKIVRNLSNTLMQFGEQVYQEQGNKVSDARDYQSVQSVKHVGKTKKEGINREPKEDALEREATEIVKSIPAVTLIYPSDVQRPSYIQRTDILENVIEDNVKQSESVRHENKEEYQEPSLETDVWEVFWDIEHNRWYYYNKILGGYEVKFI